MMKPQTHVSVVTAGFLISIKTVQMGVDISLGQWHGPVHLDAKNAEHSQQKFCSVVGINSRQLHACAASLPGSESLLRKSTYREIRLSASFCGPLQYN
jgi:hypothetical protein